MKGALLALVLTLAACTSSTTSLPQQHTGPAIPNGAHAIDVTYLGSGPAGCGTAPSVVAGPSRSEVVFKLDDRCRPQCATPGLACWAELPDQAGDFYFAVLTVNECRRPVQDQAAVNGPTLYFIHWIGKPAGVCSAMMVAPAYRLYTATRSVLPASGNVTVELQVQDVVDGTTTVDAEVSLG